MAGMPPAQMPYPAGMPPGPGGPAGFPGAMPQGAPMQMNYPLKDIGYPHPHDVLCGRGGATNQHIGNSHWRQLVSANKELYLKLPKRQKQLLSKSIVHAVRSQNPPGRFLQKHPQTDLWYDVGDNRALEKTSQALREGAPKLKKKLETSGKGGSGEGSAQQITVPPEVLPAVNIPPPPKSKKQAQAAAASAAVAPTLSPTASTVPSTGPLKAQTTGDSVGAISTGQASVHSNATQPHSNQQPLDPNNPNHYGAQASNFGTGFGSPSMPPTILPQGPVPARKGKKKAATDAPPPQAPPSFSQDPASFYGGAMQQQQEFPMQNQMQQQQQNSFPGNNGEPMPYRNSSADQFNDDEDEAALSMPPPNLADPDGYRDCSLGLVSIPDPVDGGLTENGGFSFGTVMSVESAHEKVRTAMAQDTSLLLTDEELALLAADNAHRFQASVQHYEQQEMQHRKSLPQGVEIAQVVFEKGQGQPSNGGEEMPTPVDLGLEPAGLSAGSMMSFGSLMPKLENGGLSFGSIMSYTTTPGANQEAGAVAPVDGGLEDIGASFGSMTIATNPPPAKPQHQQDPQWGAPSFQPSASSTFNNSTNKANLLECSDTESEDEEDQAKLKAQKSADWMKFKNTFEHEMQGGRVAPTTPPFLAQTSTKASFGASTATPKTARVRNLSSRQPTNSNGNSGGIPQAGDMLHIPTTNFGRDVSQMSAMSAGDDDDVGQYGGQQETGYVVPPQQIGGPAGGSADDGMPPPPPPAQLQKQGEEQNPEDEWAAYEMMNRGNSAEDGGGLLG